MVRLSDWEERELGRLARALERDDPRLAEQLRRMVVPVDAPVAVASFVLISSFVGFLLIGLGLHLGWTVCTVLGVVFTTLVPPMGGAWISHRAACRRSG